jgi:hypothetical protein
MLHGLFQSSQSRFKSTSDCSDESSSGSVDDELECLLPFKHVVRFDSSTELFDVGCDNVGRKKSG